MSRVMTFVIGVSMHNKLTTFDFTLRGSVCNRCGVLFIADSINSFLSTRPLSKRRFHNAGLPL